MLVHTPDSLQNTLDYLNYSGVVFYRDNEQFIQKKPRSVTNSPVAKKISSNRLKTSHSCLLCAITIIDDEYKVLGKNLILCSTCKPLFSEITII